MFREQQVQHVHICEKNIVSHELYHWDNAGCKRGRKHQAQ